MTAKMNVWVVLFLLLLVAGLAFGLARDLFSRNNAILAGTVIATRGSTQPYKSPPTGAPMLRVRLADGRIVDVATTNANSVAVGQDIRVAERITPWGRVWYTETN